MAGEGLDVGTLTGRIELEDRLTNVLEQVGGAIGKFEESWKHAGSSIIESATGFFTAEAALKAVEEGAHLAAETLKELTIEGSHAADIEDTFDHLTASAGLAGDVLLGKMREGLHGTVSDMDLMTRVNQNLAVGLNLSADKMEILSQGAFALAKATGGSAKEALDSLSDAMVTGRVRSIQLLTGKIDLATAEQKYAEKLGTTVDHLTQEGKQAAAQEIILERVAAATGRVGEQHDRLADKLQQVKVDFANFGEELGTAVATSPVLAAGFDAVRQALTAAFGGTQANAIKLIAETVDDLLIQIVDLAEGATDAAGVIGMEWNAAKVVFRDIMQIVDGDVLVFEYLAKAIAYVGEVLHMPGAAEEVKRLDDNIQSLLESMAKRGEQIAKDKKAEEDWAVATGQVKEKLEQIKQKMIEAKDTGHDYNEVIRDNVNEHKEDAAAADKHGDAEDRTGKVMAMSAEETKKYNEALKEMASAAGGWKATLETIPGDTVEAIKYYLDAGVALDKLATAYGLTATQASAVEKAWREGTEALKEQIKEADEEAKAWEKLNAVYDAHEGHLVRIGDKVRDDILMYHDLGASVKDLAKAYSLTEEQIEAIIKARDKEREATQKQTDAYKQQNEQLDATKVKVKTLSGEYITLAEAQQRQSGGGSTDVNRGNLAQNAAYWGIPESVAIEAAKKGFSFQEIVQAWQSHMMDTWVPRGPRIPGFRDGGVGDFGEGTLAMLHGREAIVPLDKAEGIGSTVVNNWYVNGTGAQVAAIVKDEIMRQLRPVRRFGSA